MNKSLFRPEVLEAKRGSWLGGISLTQPLQLWVLSAFAAVAVLGIILFLLLGEYSRRSRVVGQLVPSLGLSTVVAPTNGVVDRLFVEEGGRVTEAASLALISVPRITASGRDAQQALREGIEQRQLSAQQNNRSQVDLIAEQRTSYARQLSIAKHELAQVDEQIDLRDEQIQLSVATLQRYRGLLADRFVSSVQLEQQQQAVLEQRSAKQALERQATTIRQNIAQLDLALRELPMRKAMQQADGRRERAVLEQELIQNSASGELLVKAPVSGIVANRMVQPGQSVQAGQVLLSLLPQGSALEAQLLVPSRAMGFIEPGDRALLRYQAFPYQKFGHHEGVVVRVSRSALSPGELGALIGNAQGGEPLYRVLVQVKSQTVTAYGKSEPLRPGMLVEADILGDRRKLYEWALEPLYALSGKLGH